MIISASRRTDIPAFYSEWFFNRLKEGYLLVKNPMNANQVSRIPLTTEYVDCFVFWTKNPMQMIPNLGLLEEYPYYFQFTLTPYDKRLERFLPNKAIIIDQFKVLSKTIGFSRVIWRYDPIILSEYYTIEYHMEQFEILTRQLYAYTSKCIISFVDSYKNADNRMKDSELADIKPEQMNELAYKIKQIADKYDIAIETCAEEIDLNKVGIRHAKCIDPILVERLSSKNLAFRKDKNQRMICGCVESIDIGVYNSCKNGCLYCYANHNNAMITNNTKKYNPDSPILCGELNGNEIIYERPDKKNKTSEPETLF